MKNYRLKLLQNITEFHEYCESRAGLLFFGISMAFFFSVQGIAATTGNGPNNLITMIGSGSPVGNGDYYSANNGGGLNTYYSYWIEVPPGSPDLRVEIYDADVGNNLDDSLGGSFNTTVQYRLYSPAGGAPVRTASCNTTCTGLNNSNADNRWRRFSGGNINNPAAGIWELQVDMSSAVTAGNDVNTFGLRMRSGDGNTDYNVFYYFNITGSLRSVNPRTVVNYPYVTSGCSLGSNDYDFDVPGGGNGSSMSIASRQGITTAISPLSAPSAWNTQSVAVEGQDDSAEDYGVGTLTLNPRHSGAGNVASWYLNTEGSGTLAPASRFTLNNASAHRIYFPTGTGNSPGGPPAKPYLAQWVRQNDPAGNPNEFTITVRLINPTAFDINNVVVDGLVPSPVTYGGVRAGFPTHGSVTVQPGVGGSGALSWSPGTVAAGQTAVLAYNITVPDPNTVTTVTGVSTTANATRAGFDDETGTPFSTGGLCELRIGPSLTQAVVTDFKGAAYSGNGLVQWNTASEVGTLGFYIEREDPATGDWLRLNEGKLIPGLGLSDPQGGAYTYRDADVIAGKTYRYRLIEVEAKGNQRLNGPYEVNLDVEAEPAAQAALLSSAPYTVTAKQPALSVEPQQQTKDRVMTSTAASAGMPDGMRIGIRESGLYYLSAAQIAASLNITEAEVSSHIGQQYLSLRNRGNEMAWLPAENGAGLYFYAEAIDSIYTRDNVVLLTVGQGMVMAAEDGGKPAPATSPIVVTARRHFEQDDIPVLTRAVKDYWYWGKALSNVAGYQQADFDFQLYGVAAGEAELTLELEGYSETKHVVKVELNGSSLGNLSWEGLLPRKASLTVPDGLFKEGNNLLTLSHQSISEGTSWVYFDSVNVRYPRSLRSHDGSLHFEIQDQPKVTVTGFSGDGVHVLRIDHLLQPVLVENATVGTAGTGYEVSFVTGEENEGRFFVVEDAAIKSPAWMEDYTEPRLAMPANQADYLVIAPAELENGVQALAAYRSADGLITRVVTLDEIYLAFNHGIEDPAAIQRFVDYARDHWLVAPRYVVLAGDSSYDHRHILTATRDDHKVPAIFTGTADGLFAADNLYGAMRGGAPRVAVGRIPVRDNAALLDYVDKLQAWESSLTDDEVQLVADNADPAAGDFPADSDDLKVEVPTLPLAANDVYLDPADPSKAHDDLLAALDEGRELVNYLGHGGTDRLAEEGILTTADVPALANTQTPVMTALSCVVNRHAIAGIDNLGEQLVVGTDKGVVAMWAPTGLSQNAGAVDLNRALLKAVYTTGHPVLGDAIVEALKVYAPSSSQVSYMPKVYTLLGDSAVKIRPGSSLSERIYNEQLGDISGDGGTAGIFGCTGKNVILTGKQFVRDQVCMATDQLNAESSSVESNAEVTFCGPRIRLGKGFGVKGVFRAGPNLCDGTN